MSQQPVYDGDATAFNPLIEQGYTLDVGECVRRSWDIFKKNAGNFVGITFLYTAVVGLAGRIDFIGPIVSMFLSPLFVTGIAYSAYRILHGETPSFNDFFGSLRDWLQLGLGSFLTTIFTFIGFVFLIIPGIYLAVAFSMTPFLIFFSRFEFWPAMELSRKIVSRNWMSFFMLMLAAIGVNILGVLALGIGVFVSIPVSMIMYYVAFDQLMSQLPEGGQFSEEIESIGQE